MSRAVAFRLVACAAFLGMIALATDQAGADPPATTPGDLWEVTSSMSMQGFAMPAQTHKVCSPKSWTQPPGGANGPGECSTSGFHVAGPKVTWTVTCAGPPEMTGEGEITRSSADAYAGEVRFSSSEGAMTMKLSGRRLGDCNPPS